MKIITYNTLMALDHAFEEACRNYKEVSTIFETDIMFSFRVFSDDGSKTLFLHRYLKNQIKGKLI